MQRAADGGFITGFSVGHQAVSALDVSHLLFADDTLILCGADSDQLWYLQGVFTWFQAISGLKINLGKSELVPVGDVPNVQALVGILGCRVSALPLTYFGLPLGASFKNKSIWNPVVEKIEKRLAGWKRFYLSKGGRITLIKSTLSNLPTYYLSLFPIPKSVARRIEKLQRDFLWVGLDDEPKFHLVPWKRVCEPLMSGGLGIRNLTMFNQALLRKWLWRYALEPESLWRRVIDSKYGSMWGGWYSQIGTQAYGVSLWKFIRAGWNTFSNYISYMVGDGSRIKFWHDPWCGDQPLKLSFPELHSLARYPEATVAESMQFQGSSIHWDIVFIRAVKDWELEAVVSFLDLLYTSSITRGGLDSMHWKLSRSGKFEVKSYYKVLTQVDHPPFPWKSIWKVRVPTRIAFFTWTAALGKILTIDNLRKRKVLFLDWCCMCKSNGELVNHLLLHCPITRDLWDMVFSLFGVCWVMPRGLRIY